MKHYEKKNPFSFYYFLLILVTIGDFCLELVLSFYPPNVNFLFSLCFLHLLKRNSTLRKSCIFFHLLNCTIIYSNCLFSPGYLIFKNFILYGVIADLEEEMATHSSILAWRNPMDREVWHKESNTTEELST